MVEQPRPPRDMNINTAPTRRADLLRAGVRCIYAEYEAAVQERLDGEGCGALVGALFWIWQDAPVRLGT